MIVHTHEYFGCFDAFVSPHRAQRLVLSQAPLYVQGEQQPYMGSLIIYHRSLVPYIRLILIII